MPPVPELLKECVKQQLLKMIEKLSLWEIFDPQNGLFVALSDEKYNTKVLEKILDLIFIHSRAVKYFGREVLEIRPRIRCGYLMANNLDRLQFPEVNSRYNKFECSKYFHEIVLLPLFKKLIDKGSNESIKSLCHLFLFLDKDYWLGKLFVPTSVYAVYNHNIESFAYFLKLKHYSKSHLLSQTLAGILKAERKDKYAVFNDLLNQFRDKLKLNLHDGLKILNAFVEQGLTAEVFNEALRLEDSLLKEAFEDDELLKTSYKFGNTSIFLHLINSYPERITEFEDPALWSTLIEKPPQIIEYLCEKLPNILPLIDSFLCGDENSDALRVISPISLDLRNLYEVPYLFKYFSKRKTIDLLFDQWLKHMEVTYEDSVSTNFYVSTLLDIIRCRDAYGLPIEEIGNKFCRLCMNLSTLVVLFGFTPALSNVIAQVLTIFMEYGFTYTKSYPWELDGSLKSR